MSRQSWGVALLLLCMTHSSFALDVITGRVVSIADGDTVTVLDAANQQHKIRLSGIDAPEKAQVRIPMKGATDSNPKPATFSGRKPTTHPHGYRQGQMYAHIVAAWVGASG